MTAQLRLHALFCRDMEGDVFDDRPRLKIKPDTGPEHVLDGIKMEDGVTWILEDQTPVRFSKTVAISLWDRDGIDDDDYLGGVNVGSTPGEHKDLFQVKGEDWLYELHFHVEAVTDPKPPPQPSVPARIKSCEMVQVTQ